MVFTFLPFCFFTFKPCCADLPRPPADKGRRSGYGNRASGFRHQPTGAGPAKHGNTDDNDNDNADVNNHNNTVINDNVNHDDGNHDNGNDNGNGNSDRDCDDTDDGNPYAPYN